MSSKSSEAESEDPGETASRQRSTICWAEIKADASDQGASLHSENNIRSEVSKLDCLQGPLPRNEIHKGVEVAREVGKWTRDQDKVVAIRREFLDKSRAWVTGIKILCTLFEVTTNNFFSITARNDDVCVRVLTTMA